jgi:UDP:flavonoid glycosyltransferase YjiC (YdhE family)
VGNRVLIAPLASPGFVFSSLAVAERARAAGNDVAFVTDLSFADTIASRGFARIPRGAGDGHSFQLDGWGHPLQIAMQVKHLELALAAFRPDVILASNLAMGPLLVARAHRIPVAVLGSVVFLWPDARAAARPPAEATARRLAWRYREQMQHLETAAATLGLPAFAPAGSADNPLLGDRFLIQGVPELQRDDGALPDACRFVGSCTYDALDAPSAEELAWLRAQRACRRALVYVQLGRIFESAPVWEAFRDWAVARDVAAVVCSERHDRPLDGVPDHVLVVPRIAQDAVMPFADAAVTTGHPTAVLGALSHGAPLVMLPSGSGTEEIAEACTRFGAALSPERAGSAPADLARALDRVLDEPGLRAAARRLQALFAAYDGPANVCRELDALAAAPARATASAAS